MQALGAAFALIAIWLLWFAVRDLLEGIRSRTWPSVKGVIRSVEIRKKLDGDGDPLHNYRVRYAYTVDGQKFRGTRIRIGTPRRLVWFRPDDPKLSAFRDGARVSVHYDPADPSRCTLRGGVSGFVFVVFTAAGLAAWLGFVLLF